MAERSTSIAHELQALILEGQVTHTFTLLGFKVVMKLFPIGTRKEILLRVNAPDEKARDELRTMLALAYALRSVGDEDFDKDQTKKEAFVEALSDPVYDLFVGEYLLARSKQHEEIQKRHEQLKKSSPDQS